jgi:hypothetical protein
MSHLVSIATQVRDSNALTAACKRLQWPIPQLRQVALFTSSVTGWAVVLPGWHYPVVCDVTAGRVHYDNFEGRWGDVTELHRLLQAYAVEKIRIEALRSGHTVTETTLACGSVRLELLTA